MLDIGSIASIASALAVIVALVFGVLQVRHLTKTRAIFSSAELVRTMQTQEFTSAVGIVAKLPDHAAPDHFRRDPDAVAAAVLLGHVYESLGVLVYYRILPLRLVDDLLGGYVRMSWAKLGPFIESRRKELGVSYGEWTQWLAERLLEVAAPAKKVGAHVAHRDWRP